MNGVVNLEENPVYSAKREWLKPRKGTPRMFENPLLEKLSRVHPVVPLVIYLPLVVFFIYLSSKFFDFGTILALFILGIFIWTLMEYSLHRFIFHWEPENRVGKWLHFIMHGVHHMYPWDFKRLVMPPSISIPLAAIIGGIMYWIGGTFSFPVFAGTVTGYLVYDMTHFAVHYFKAPKNRILRYLWRHHLQHHFTTPDRKFGVSSPLWDVIFGTL